MTAKDPPGKKGRELVMDYFRLVEARAPVQAKKSLMVLRMTFDHAINLGHLGRPGGLCRF